MLLASSELRLGMLVDILQYTGRPQHQELFGPKMLIVARLTLDRLVSYPGLLDNF